MSARRGRWDRNLTRSSLMEGGHVKHLRLKYVSFGRAAQRKLGSIPTLGILDRGSCTGLRQSCRWLSDDQTAWTMLIRRLSRKEVFVCAATNGDRVEYRYSASKYGASSLVAFLSSITTCNVSTARPHRRITRLPRTQHHATLVVQITQGHVAIFLFQAISDGTVHSRNVQTLRPSGE